MLTGKHANKIMIRKSSLDGANQGLFAKKVFHKGDRVCEYAGYIKTKTEMADLYQRNFEDYTKHHKYVRDLDDDHVVVGSHLLAENDMFKSGVYVNDGACLDLNITYNPSIHKEILAEYVKNSRAKQNVEAVVEDGKIYYVALKRIKKGEEFYAHYGKHYWLLLSGISAEQLHKF